MIGIPADLRVTELVITLFFKLNNTYNINLHNIDQLMKLWYVSHINQVIP